jgi:hypothetical protein
MPKCSLATWENRIRDNNLNVELPRSAVKKLAKTMSRVHESYIHAPDEMEQLLAYCLHYWDETGEAAIENVRAAINKAAAAQRVVAA